MKEIKEIEPNTGPLAGLKVLDLTRVLAGPFASMWLGAMGADVIKIENPKDPDITRNYGPFVNRKSAYFSTINRNKRAITLNLKTEEGKQLFMELAKDADVVLENFRPGVTDKLGVGYDQIKEINPGIIYASISGFGTYGPYRDRPGYDTTAQAMSGLMYLTGPMGSEPTRVGSSIGDTVGGITCLVAILAALYCRNKTGLGQKVETSLVEALISLSTQDYIRYFTDGEVPIRMGNIYKTWTPYGAYKAADGYYCVGCGTEQHFRLFAKAIGREKLADMKEYCSHDARVAHREELDAIINEWAKNKTVKEICDLMVAAGVPCAPVNSIVELTQDEHIAGARGMFPTLDQPGVGKFRITNIPVRFSGSGLAPLSPAPELGANNEEIYGALNRSTEELARLREQGVI